MQGSLILSRGVGALYEFVEIGVKKDESSSSSSSSSGGGLSPSVSGRRRLSRERERQANGYLLTVQRGSSADGLDAVEVLRSGVREDAVVEEMTVLARTVSVTASDWCVHEAVDVGVQVVQRLSLPQRAAGVRPQAAAADDDVVDMVDIDDDEEDDDDLSDPWEDVSDDDDDASAAAPAAALAAPPSPPANLGPLADGESVQVSNGQYTIKNTGGVYYCTCPAWRFQSGGTLRTCKHLRELRGEEAEKQRLSAGGVPMSKHPRRAAAASSSSSSSSSKVKSGQGATGGGVLLAKKYDASKNDPTGWWISEKLDGVRAYWTGSRFVSRNGNEFYAPDFFIEGLPDEALDGELWLGRGAFQQCMSVVRRQDRSKHWAKIKYMVFDAPNHGGDFEQRLEHVRGAVANCQYAHVVEHTVCKGVEHMKKELDRVLALKGEGLMLRKPGSQYARSRSSSLLKVKTFHDDEAIIIEHVAGKGRHHGRMGAVRVRNDKGYLFKVGSGFTDKERDRPPAIGTIITYRFQELTSAGIPRFPTFLRVRHDVDRSRFE